MLMSSNVRLVWSGWLPARILRTRLGHCHASPSLNKVECISRGAPLEHVVSRVCASTTALPVVDDEDRYCGSVDQAAVLKVITRNRGGAHV